MVRTVVTSVVIAERRRHRAPGLAGTGGQAGIVEVRLGPDPARRHAIARGQGDASQHGPRERRLAGAAHGLGRGERLLGPPRG